MSAKNVTPTSDAHNKDLVRLISNRLRCMRDWNNTTVTPWIPVELGIGLWQGRRWKSAYDRMTNNQTGDSDGTVTTSTRAMLIHTICEWDNAWYMNLVKTQVQNFIIFGVDALIIWSSKCLLLLSIIRTNNISSVRKFNCGNQPTISMSILQLLETPTVVTSPRSQLLVLQDG